jgi:uncharacterized protein (DUF1697 family)
VATTRYIAFLRAVNVGGRTVKMDRLRALFEDLKLDNVRTYIQTGNVFFDTDEPDRAALTGRIERHLEKALGYEVTTFLRTVDEVAAMLAADPFGGRERTDDTRLTVVFTAEPFVTDEALPLTSAKGDMEVVGADAGAVFVVWHIIGGRPPTGAFLEKTIPGPTTSRFLHTTVKILAAARG